MTHTVLLLVVFGLAFAVRPVAAGDVEEAIPADPGETLRVELDRGDVDVTTHDEHVVRVSARVTGDPIWRADVDLRRGADLESVELVGRVAAGDGVVAKTIAWGLWPLWPVALHVQVAVPRDYSAVVRTARGRITATGIHGRVTLETSGGAIAVRDVVGDVESKTAGGAIEVTAVDGRVLARTGGGRVTVERISGAVDAQTAGGRIDVRDAAGEVTATTSGGAIFSSFTGAPHGRLETSGGRIEVLVPVGAGADLDAQTSGGRVEVADALVVAATGDAQRLVGRLNAGGAPLRLRTAGGDIYLGAR